jgi:Fe2+ transport system protein FeoA
VNLADAEIGNPVTVRCVGGERSFRRRLLELGVLPGTSITVHQVAPLGDPLELRIRGCSLSIRKSEAAVIEVEPA